MKRKMSLRSNRNKPSVESTELHGQISTSFKSRQPFVDDTNDKDSIDIDYEDEISLQETIQADTRIVKLNDRNIKGQSRVYNVIEEQKFNNSQKNSRTDPIARPASIICSI